MAIEDIADTYGVQINQQEFCQSALLQLTPVTTSPALPTYESFERRLHSWITQMSLVEASAA